MKAWRNFGRLRLWIAGRAVSEELANRAAWAEQYMRERDVLADALVLHEDWCGHSIDAPGHSIVNHPYVREVMGR